MKRPDLLPYKPIELATTVEGFVDYAQQLENLGIPAFASIPRLDSSNGDKVSVEDAVEESDLRYDP